MHCLDQLGQSNVLLGLVPTFLSYFFDEAQNWSSVRAFPACCLHALGLGM